jgi:EmrB/QacA subfamily drug resistance transporter
MHDASRLHPRHSDPSIVVERRRRQIALAVLCMCALTTAIDMTITNLALPFIGRELDASISELQWVIDAYNIVLAGLLVLGGGLADRYGRRKVFLGGYALFGLACLLAAFSPSALALIGARALMGVGAAAVIAPALAIVAGLFPPEERGTAIAAWAVFGAAGLALGPIIGGILLDHFWWGSIFLVNVPFVALGVVVGLRVIPESRREDVTHLDVPGALLSVLGLGVLLFGVIEGPERGWTSVEVIVALVGGALLLVGFVRRELTTEHPLLDLRILRRPAVAGGATTLFVAYVLFTGMLFLLPQWLQDVRRESIITVGLVLVPFAAVFGIASLRSAAITARLGTRTTITAGLVVAGIGMALLGAFAHGGTVPTVIASAVVGIGLSGLIAPPSTAIMNALPPERAGDGSSLSMVSRFVGAAIGVAVIGSVYASVLASRRDETTYADAFDDAVRAGYLVGAALALVGALWCWHALRTVDD